MLDKKPAAPATDATSSDQATGQAGLPSKSDAQAPGDDGTPAILKMFKNQSNMTRSFYIASMQKGGVAGGRGMGSTMSSTILKSGGGGVAALQRRAAKPQWMVGEALVFTLAGSELVRESNIISASLGINHIALLTGMLTLLLASCLCHEFPMNCRGKWYISGECFSTL